MPSWLKPNPAPAKFPPEFLFGVATADHQCEAYDGADDIRDVWERVRGLTPRGSATDFWNRYSDDIELAEGLGCGAFRISLSWARLEPQLGQWDEKAFTHYRDLLKRIRANGMKSVVTLHHNTWPRHVHAGGNGAGMLDDAFPDRFADYAQKVAVKLGDCIDYYVTINEPNQLVYGYIKGWWMRSYAGPPGLPPYATSTDQMSAVLKLIPNLFLAHARARKAIKGVQKEALVGTNPCVLGLPGWVQGWVARCATHAQNPDDLQVQGRRLAQQPAPESGVVDISIAQITFTHDRMDQVLFSEAYFIAHLSLLCARTFIRPAAFAEWIGRVGVTVNSAAAQTTPTFFTKAKIQNYAGGDAAVEALQRGEIDVVFDDDVVLRPHESEELTLMSLDAPDQPFAVAMAPGH